ncbi:MAG: adenylate kinase [Spirochaetales bacterium]|nr:adenylate kinase [Spirochaetales bacterium]
MNLIFTGPPGAGKGTIASRISEELKIPHISTGDLFRKAIKEKTPLGLRVESILASGELVPDDVTCGIVEERLKLKDAVDGFILDGFPRTIVQAEALSGITRIDGVVNFLVEDQLIIRRLSGRRICRNCGAGYHVDFMPPKKEGICDVCGGELYTRPDDAIEAIQNRLEVYRVQTSPLIDYYRRKDLIIDVDGSPDAASVTTDVLKLLTRLQAHR